MVDSADSKRQIESGQKQVDSEASIDSSTVRVSDSKPDSSDEDDQKVGSDSSDIETDSEMESMKLIIVVKGNSIQLELKR